MEDQQTKIEEMYEQILKMLEEILYVPSTVLNDENQLSRKRKRDYE